MNALSEQELEAMIFGNQPTGSTEVKKETESVVKVTEEMVKPEVVPVSTPPEPQVVQATAPTPVVKEGEDWEKRFKQFKPKADRTIHTLRRDNASLNTRLAELMKEVNDLRTSLDAMSLGDAPDIDILTAEDKTLLGEDTAEVFQKGVKEYVNQAVDPLKQQLKEEKEKRVQDQQKYAKDLKEKEVEDFTTALSQIVPDYVDIDTDPLFHEWLNGLDDSGFPRWDLFRLASQNREASRVAKFFTDYKAHKGSDLEAHLTPAGSSSNIPTSSGNEPAWMRNFHANPQRFIVEFYDEWTNGDEFKGQKGEALAQEIDDYITLATVGKQIR